MICLSSAGSLASFDGKTEGSKSTGGGTPVETGAHSRRRVPYGSRAKPVAEGVLQPFSTLAVRGRACPTMGRDCRGLSRCAQRAQRPPSSGPPGGGALRGVEVPLEETCSTAELGSAICVQNFDDSLNSAIRITYRISLRSSSLREPRHPSLKVVMSFFIGLKS